MPKIKRSKAKGPVRAKKTTYDGINFASGLEKYMYVALKKSNISATYEGQTFELLSSFNIGVDCYERCSNGKGDFKNRGNSNVLNIKYTPDFVGEDFIIECKGRANESFPIRWKMFKRMISDGKIKPYALYKPQNQKECDQVIDLILSKQKK